MAITLLKVGDVVIVEDTEWPRQVVHVTEAPMKAERLRAAAEKGIIDKGMANLAAAVIEQKQWSTARFLQSNDVDAEVTATIQVGDIVVVDGQSYRVGTTPSGNPVITNTELEDGMVVDNAILSTLQ